MLDRFPQVRGIRVTVRKPHAPIAATFDDVGVIVDTQHGNARGHDHGRGILSRLAAMSAMSGPLSGGRLSLFCDGTAVRLIARSSDYRTPPWGVTDQPPFINAVIGVDDLARRRMNCSSRAQAMRTGARP